MKSIFLILAIIFAAASANAQKPNKERVPTPTPTPERPREIVALLNDARLAAPELAIDTFLKVIESKKITDTVWQREVLEEALRLTDDVKYPVRLRSVYYSGAQADTRAGYFSYAYDMRLDALSLKARIIKLLLPAETARAKQIVFQMGGTLGLKRRTCEDTMTYMVEDIYSAVEEVAKAGFSQKEITDGLRSAFVLPWIENIESVSQIGPAADLGRDLQGSPIEKQILFNALAAAIDRNFADDRTFNEFVGYRRLTHNIGPITSGYFDQSKINLRNAYRDFLAKNAGGPRCADSKPPRGQLPTFISEVNDIFYREKPFVVEDFESVEYKGKLKIVDYFESEAFVNFLRKYRNSRDRKNETEKKGETADQVQWELKVGELLEDLEKWEPKSKDDEADTFGLKCVFYQGLIRESPDGKVLETVMRSFFRYLNNSPVQKNSFIEWYYHAKWFAETYPKQFKEISQDFANQNFDVLNRRNDFLKVVERGSLRK